MSLTTVQDDYRFYRPLEENEIRVLEILPGLDRDIVQCRLKSIKLDGSTEYDALSYTWGDPKLPKVTIIVDGYDKGVTESCKLALEEPRQEAMAKSRTQVIWIDAICINQADTLERNQQILFMGKIYQNAKKTVIWLGVEADGSHEAIEMMKEIPGEFDKDAIVQWLIGFQMRPDATKIWLSVVYFFSRPWFTRVWVIQEFVVGFRGEGSEHLRTRNEEDIIEFYCGRSRVNPIVLTNIIAVAKVIDDSKSGIRTGRRFLQPLLGRGAFCFIMLMERAVELQDKVFNFPEEFLRCVLGGLHCASTEPRDRIYAYLGLVMHIRCLSYDFIQDHVAELSPGSQTLIEMAHKTGLTPQACLAELLPLKMNQHRLKIDRDLSELIVDYSASIEDVYSSFVRYTVLATGSLDILSLCYRRSSHVRRTWTIDLEALSSHEKHFNALDLDKTEPLLGSCLLFNNRHKSFQASKDAHAEAKFSSDLSVLSVGGIRISVITDVFNMRLSRCDSKCLSWEKDFLKKILKSLASAEDDYTSPEAATQYLWDTLTGGKDCRNDHELFEWWKAWLDSDAEECSDWEGDSESDESSIEESLVDDVAKSFISLLWMQRERSLFLLDNMMLGKGWKSAAPGDIVCVIFGCNVPLVLRPVGSHYELIGDCYVEDIMKGEAMEAVYDYSSEVDELEGLNDDSSKVEETNDLEDELSEEDVMTFDLH